MTDRPILFSAPMVRAILAMAHSLDLPVVAEGVETQAQAAWLRDHGAALHAVGR